jgi:hypothetical protein
MPVRVFAIDWEIIFMFLELRVKVGQMMNCKSPLVLLSLRT